MSEYRNKKKAEKFILSVTAISITVITLELGGRLWTIDTYLLRLTLLTLATGMLLYRFSELRGFFRKQEEKTEARFSIFLDQERFGERIKHLIAQSKRYSHEFSVVCIGFDGLDILFPETGTNIRKGIEYSLNSILRECDFLTHDTSGNILACLPMTTEKWDLTAVSEKIIYSMNSYFYISSLVKNIKTNLGIARYPDSAIAMEELLVISENAMLESRTRGGNTFMIHE